MQRNRNVDGGCREWRGERTTRAEEVAMLVEEVVMVVWGKWPNASEGRRVPLQNPKPTGQGLGYKAGPDVVAAGKAQTEQSPSSRRRGQKWVSNCPVYQDDWLDCSFTNAT